MNKLLNLLIQNIETIIDLLTPIRYCDEGFNIVRKTFGIPVKIERIILSAYDYNISIRHAE